MRAIEAAVDLDRIEAGRIAFEMLPSAGKAAAWIDGIDQPAVPILTRISGG